MEAFYEVSKEFPKKWLSMFWDILVSCYFNGPTTNEDMGGGGGLNYLVVGMEKAFILCFTLQEENGQQKGLRNLWLDRHF